MPLAFMAWIYIYTYIYIHIHSYMYIYIYICLFWKFDTWVIFRCLSQATSRGLVEAEPQGRNWCHVSCSCLSKQLYILCHNTGPLGFSLNLHLILTVSLFWDRPCSPCGCHVRIRINIQQAKRLLKCKYQCLQDVIFHYNREAVIQKLEQSFFSPISNEASICNSRRLEIS